MKKSMLAVALAATVSLSACTTNSEQAGNIAQGAAIGGVAGTAAGALIPGVGIIEGAAIGAAVGGLAGAVWVDNNSDGYADGYVQNGQYYAGQPQGYDPTLRRVVTGAGIGAVGGAVAGAVIPGLSPITGAVIGAANGQADGYMYNGTYYQGTPQGYTPSSAPPPMPAERG
jgi:hypothetical protein